MMAYKKFIYFFLFLVFVLGAQMQQLSAELLQDTFYSVHIVMGQGSTVLYEGSPLKEDELLHGVLVPMHLVFNGQEVNIYFNPAIILSQSPEAHRIVIKDEGNNKFLLIFPGK